MASPPWAKILSASMSRPESVSSRMGSRGSSTAMCRISLRFFSPPEKPSFTERFISFSSMSSIFQSRVRGWRLIRFLVTPHRPSLVTAHPMHISSQRASHSKRACLLSALRPDAGQLFAQHSYKYRRRCKASSLIPASQPAPLNLFPFALKVYPGCFLHFLNSLGLFFSCSNADSTTSALGMSGSVAIEKHVYLRGGGISRTNLYST